MPRTPLYVAADVHGHRAEFGRVLRGQGLIDGAGVWIGGGARLWLLGDYVDRGPDGIGVIDDIRRLAVEAAAAGGEVRALLGNHEAQLLGAYRFGDAAVDGWDQPDGFRGGWLKFGGRPGDLEGLTPEHVEWITGLPAVGVVDGFLLVHSDTIRYLEFGSTIEEINASVAAVLFGTDAAGYLEFCGRMSDRGAFRTDAAAASVMLDALGGRVLVHGHSTLPKYFGIAAPDVREALHYADGRVIAIDGGVHEGGRILLTRLR